MSEQSYGKEDPSRKAEAIKNAAIAVASQYGESALITGSVAQLLQENVSMEEVFLKAGDLDVLISTDKLNPEEISKLSSLRFAHGQVMELQDNLHAFSDEQRGRSVAAQVGGQEVRLMAVDDIAHDTMRSLVTMLASPTYLRINKARFDKQVAKLRHMSEKGILGKSVPGTDQEVLRFIETKLKS